jgi:hypothetical protein
LPIGIKVFKDRLTNKTIWETLQKTEKLKHKRFIFHCQNIRGFYHLVDWEEVEK